MQNLLALLLCCSIQHMLHASDSDPDRAKPAKGPDNIDVYTFTAKDITGKTVELSQYRGKVVLVVNVASECGFTDGHYKGLQQLHDLLHISERFTILAFPCNQFGEQEPACNADVAKFAKDRYKVTFPLFEKIDVKGDNAHPLYKYLGKAAGQEPNWNFWKYLIDYNGRLINFWGPWSNVEEIKPYVKEAVDEAVREAARARQAKLSAGMPSTEGMQPTDQMGRPPPLPLHRARPPPPPQIPAPFSAQPPPPPPEGYKLKKPLPPPPIENKGSDRRRKARPPTAYDAMESPKEPYNPNKKTEL